MDPVSPPPFPNPSKTNFCRPFTEMIVETIFKNAVSCFQFWPAIYLQVINNLNVKNLLIFFNFFGPCSELYAILLVFSGLKCHISVTQSPKYTWLSYHLCTLLPKPYISFKFQKSVGSRSFLVYFIFVLSSRF